MKRKLSIFSVIGALAITSIPASVYAMDLSVDPDSPGQATYNATSYDEKTTNVVNFDDGTSGSEIVTQEISTDAETIGQGDFIHYNITMEWGDMDFSYNFGKGWDADNLEYSDGPAGWDLSRLKGKTNTSVDNNTITITNRSNYPISAVFKHTLSAPASAADPYELANGLDGSQWATYFNPLTTEKNAVTGIFYNPGFVGTDEFDGDGAAIGGINLADYNGASSTKVKALLTHTLNIDTVATDCNGIITSSMTSTQNITYVDDAPFVTAGPPPSYTAPTGTVCFTLCGTPNRNANLTAATPVGKISVVIKPYKK